MGGSLAHTNLPAAITSATYDANNRLTNWNGASMIQQSTSIAILVAVGMGILIGAALSFQFWLQRRAFSDARLGVELRGWYTLHGRLAAYVLSFVLMLVAAFIARWGTGIPRPAFVLLCFGTAILIALPFYYFLWKARDKR